MLLSDLLNHFISIFLLISFKWSFPSLSSGETRLERREEQEGIKEGEKKTGVEGRRKEGRETQAASSIIIFDINLADKYEECCNFYVETSFHK